MDGALAVSRWTQVVAFGSGARFERSVDALADLSTRLVSIIGEHMRVLVGIRDDEVIEVAIRVHIPATEARPRFPLERKSRHVIELLVLGVVIPGAVRHRGFENRADIRHDVLRNYGTILLVNQRLMLGMMFRRNEVGTRQPRFEQAGRAAGRNGCRPARTTRAADCDAQ